jgi:hypothetical protein
MTASEALKPNVIRFVFVNKTEEDTCEIHMKFWWINRLENDHLEDREYDGSMILIYILKILWNYITRSRHFYVHLATKATVVPQAEVLVSRSPNMSERS